MRTGMAVIGGGFLCFIWLILLSRLPWRKRVLGVLAAVLALATLPVLLRIRGVSGDLVPIVEFRWKSPRETAPPLSPASAIQTNVHPELSFPQLAGPNRNGELSEPRLATNWLESPPRLRWRKPAGAAWSGFVVAGQRAVTQEQQGESEAVVCYDLLSGQVIWTHTDSARYATTIAGEGPRATPTIVSNLVYTMGGTGLLNCLNLHDGTKRWSRQVLTDHGASLPDWGLAASPLVWKDQVLVTVGGPRQSALASYRAEDGEPLWSAGTGGPDYSSPVVLPLLGQEQIVLFTTSGLNGMNDSDEMLWQYPWPGGHPHISLPLLLDTNSFVASSGYGTGAERIRLERGQDGKISAHRVWKSLAMKSKFGMLHEQDGFLYGLDDGMMACVDLADGKRRWKDGRYGHGQSLLVAGSILMMAENGEIILIQPNPERLVELARFRVLSAKTWNPPCLAGEYLLVRNDQEMACFQLGVVPK